MYAETVGALISLCFIGLVIWVNIELIMTLRPLRAALKLWLADRNQYQGRRRGHVNE